MVEIKAVKEAAPDPKIGKPRPKSGVSVPYYDINQSIAVATAIHEQGGGSCSREQLATLLKYSGTNNGGFLTRVSAAKMFGLVDESSETLRVSQRGRTILAPVMPVDAERAKVDAFLAVDFFAKFYERFKGTTLPQEAGLKNLLENTYAIVPGRLVASLRVLMDSADQAGFFKTAGNRSRMVMPLSSNGNPAGAQPASEQSSKTEHNVDGKGHQQSHKQERHGGSGGDGTGDGIHRFELPIPGKPSVQVLVPESLDAADWDMLSQMFSIYVNRWKGYTPPPQKAKKEETTP